MECAGSSIDKVKSRYSLHPEFVRAARIELRLGREVAWEFAAI